MLNRSRRSRLLTVWLAEDLSRQLKQFAMDRDEAEAVIVRRILRDALQRAE